MSIGECNIHYNNIRLVVKTNIQWSIALSSIVGARKHIGVSERPTTLYHFIHIIITHNTMPTLAELSTFSALPQGQQTILRIAARINEVLRRCHQQGVEPSPAVLWHIEDALDTALELGMDNPILWPHPVITEVATVIYGNSTPRLGDVNLRRIAIDCVANECKGVSATTELERFLDAGNTRSDSPKWWRPDFESGDIEQDQEMQSPDISVSSMDYILNQTASEDGEIKDGEIEEIPMEEYDTRRCGQCNLNDRHCEIQDQVQSDGAYECTHCAEHGIRCWPPAGWALPLLYAMRDRQMSSRGCDIVISEGLELLGVEIGCIWIIWPGRFRHGLFQTRTVHASRMGRVWGSISVTSHPKCPKSPLHFPHTISIIPIASMSNLRLEYLKYTDEQQDMLLVACRIIEAVRARDQGNAIPDKDFKKHLKREVKRSLEHLSVHPAIKLASSLWEGETVTPLDELTMERITKACQKSKREGVLSSTDLEEVMIEDGELDRWWLPPAAEEMEVDEPGKDPNLQEHNLKLTRRSWKASGPPESEGESLNTTQTRNEMGAPGKGSFSIQNTTGCSTTDYVGTRSQIRAKYPDPRFPSVNTEGTTQGAAEQEEGSSPTPQNTYITEEGTVNMIKKDYKKDRCGPCNYAKLECTIQPDAFETRSYECIRPETHLRSNKSTTNFVTAHDLQKQIKKLTEVLKDGTAGRPDRPIPSPSVSLHPIHSAVPSPILLSSHNLAEGVAGPSRLPAGSSTVRSTGALAKRVSSTSCGRK
ncbi:hypothetical protein BC834DRAFT_1036663 [Gloeopeniophorella convolvens]|nr:hypothetical protein BC834DRAFT_1036663 [Gloeopeniophorella convolvens]